MIQIVAPAPPSTAGVALLWTIFWFLVLENVEILIHRRRRREAMGGARHV